ncbi:MAG TPA: peptidoglycan-binding domain-containing protein [Rhabdaerophilum sp.]|nr:peptidoglycan-binding domain-containing protein [Rhabdaerophilum sp.]
MSEKTKFPAHAARRRPADEHEMPRARSRTGFVTRGKAIVAVACLFGGAVVANALLMQSGKHPAPMFRSVNSASAEFPMPPQRPGANPAVKNAAFAPMPMSAAKPAPIDRTAGATAAADPGEALLLEIQRELAKRGYYKGDPDGKTGPRTTQAIRDFQFAQRVAVDGRPSEALLQSVLTTKVTMKDELLDLVRKTSQPEPAKGPMLDIQRALNKAGYGPLEEDGHMGPSTRQALARFEADKKLPPRGEPKGPVLQLLASATGIAIRQP